VAIGFGSTGIVDLALEFRILEFGKWGRLRLGVKSCELPIHEVLIESGPSDHGKI
jgi:hypothetical protein